MQKHIRILNLIVKKMIYDNDIMRVKTTNNFNILIIYNILR